VSASRTPVRLGALLDACLDRATGTPGAAVIWRVWDDAVGPQIARRAQPVRLRAGTLVVAVSSAPWMQELQLLKRTMRDQLNAHLPAPVITDLRFTLTTFSEPPALPEPRRAPAPRCTAPPAADHLESLPEPIRRSFSDMLTAWRRRAWS
jgi:predicted nucleic acid-binding Zn ribbon protein